MNINRNNYESYFLDYFEHALDPGQVAELMVFLEANPDLNEEFESFETVIIPPEVLPFQKKDILKKRVFISRGRMNALNYEHYLVAGIENELTQEELADLKEFLNVNPEARREYDLFLKTRLVPDNLTYADKPGLKRKGIVALYRKEMVIALALAASILVFLALFLQPGDPAREPETFSKELIPTMESLDAELPESAGIPEDIPQKAIDMAGMEPVSDPPGNFSGAGLTPLKSMIKKHGKLLPNFDQSLPASISYRNSFSLPMVNSNRFNRPDEQPSFASRFLKGAFNNLFDPQDRSKKSLLEYTVNGYNLMADREIQIEKEYNSSGRVIAYHLNGELIKIGRKIDAGTWD